MEVGNVSKKKIDVVAAIIVSVDRKILIAQRASTSSFPNKWEFPGGKLNPMESAENALKREITEELGVEIEQLQFWTQRNHEYEEVQVRLRFYFCALPAGYQIQKLVHQDLRWVELHSLKSYDFLEADLEILDLLIERLR